MHEGCVPNAFTRVALSARPAFRTPGFLPMATR
jgi:hypothetical protein